MGVETVSAAWLAVVVSEAVAVYLIARLWRSGDLLALKIALSLLALVPIIGPVMVAWIANFPAKAAETLQDRTPAGPLGRNRGDYYLRWREILTERNPVRRFRLWRAEVERGIDDR